MFMSSNFVIFSVTKKKYRIVVQCISINVITSITIIYQLLMAEKYLKDIFLPDYVEEIFIHCVKRPWLLVSHKTRPFLR